STDMIRWTFTIDPTQRFEVETYLSDLGLDVHVRDGQQFTVMLEEPEFDLDEVVEELWALNGSPFEVTHEAFHRLDHLVYHAEEESAVEAA
ncbi:MAG TPA: hypothetical protein VFT74_00750, partial [Isosphaeraceae bacterium]|nr:hypothetical protein [Isosphaeraceae bacterium]